MRTPVWHAIAVLYAGIAVAAWITPSFADEGMWTFDNPPRKQLKERYGFEPTRQWLDHVRLASVRVGAGGSGSFVSPNGLLLTNHHVGRGQLQNLSTRDRDLVRDGFYARTLDEELKCPDLELNVLTSMENVTAGVLEAVKAGMTPQEALDARRRAMARIAKESTEQTGLRSDLVTLYNGGEYWLYRYKKYTDVRLVMAPEGQIAFYGGDPDNFTFPRHDIDICFFRAYENGKPAKTEHFLKWKTAGAADHELVFVSGHPGSTNRLQTYAQTEYLRDFSYPSRLKSAARRIALLKNYSARGPEQARQAAGTIFGLENSKKVQTGEYRGLLDKDLMAKIFQRDRDLRDRVEANPEWKKEFGWAWDTLATVLERQKPTSRREIGRAIRGRLYSIALQLVEAAEELKKPDGQRLSAYQDARIQSTKFRLFSPAPIYPELEELQIADGLAESIEILGKDDAFLKEVLAGRTPEQVARELVEETTVKDVSVRKKLFEGGAEAIAASTDPMIVVARRARPILNENREWTERFITGPQTAANEALGRARFAVYGKEMYPDATFTLRLSYGTVKGHPMNGTQAPTKTTLYGLYDRALGFGDQGPWKLPERFRQRVGSLTLATPLNFVSTCDIIGGNSGSPVINRGGELVGLVFDGNIESLSGRFLFDEIANRAVSVHPGAIIEALRKIYDAAPLADELEGVGK